MCATPSYVDSGGLAAVDLSASWDAQWEIGLTSWSSEICADPRSPQDLALGQRRKHDAARGAVESPESLGLARREAQSWHFAVLSLRSMQEIVE